MRTLSHAAWMDEGRALYGNDAMKWKFVCPVCKFVQTAEDYKAAGAPQGAIGISCVGRWRARARGAFEEGGPGPCNYAGYGLFRLNPVKVVSVTPSETIEHWVFAFAEVEHAEVGSGAAQESRTV
jgi:hypothetical protein